MDSPKFVDIELFIVCMVIPLIFIFLWCLIVGDFNNFRRSGRSYKEFSAQDPINCYQCNFKTQKDE